MRYLIITSEFPPGPGGIGKHAYGMAKGIAHNGIEVVIVCNMDYTNEDEITIFLSHLPKGITVHRIQRNGLKTYINRVQTVLRLCKTGGFDKVIVSGQFSLLVGYFLKRKYKSKIIVEGFVHGSELFMGGLIKQKLTIKSLEHLDKVYAVSNYTANLIRDIKSNYKTEVLPNGIDVSEWNTTNEVSPFEWEGYPKLLTVGSVSKRKGQHNIIKTLPEILKKFPKAHYHIVGKNNADNYLDKLILNFNLSKHVTIHGKLSDMDLKKAYKSVDIFCMLSERTKDGDVEGFGIAILEASINGVPSIGSIDTGTVDAIQESYNGYTINPHNSIDIIEVIEKILKSDKLVIKQNCLSWANQHNWNNLAKKLL